MKKIFGFPASKTARACDMIFPLGQHAYAGWRWLAVCLNLNTVYDLPTSGCFHIFIMRIVIEHKWSRLSFARRRHGCWWPTINEHINSYNNSLFFCSAFYWNRIYSVLNRWIISFCIQVASEKKQRSNWKIK